ncbi:hypothetical protein CPC16_010140 [Podila verticillata]|nr:hypothetical protein CPC16_010140 [Podila verticillata]
MEERALECGLQSNGQASSSFVLSIQGRANVLLLVLHAAMQVLKKISLKVHHDHPSVSGWSRFVEDLLQCCVIHCRIQRDTANKGKYPRLEMYAKMNLLDVYVKRMQWLGCHPFDPRNTLQKMNREVVVQNALATFKKTLQEVRENDQINLWHETLHETLHEAHHLEARMETARCIALGELNKPPFEEEAFKIFRTKPTKFRGADL